MSPDSSSCLWPTLAQYRHAGSPAGAPNRTLPSRFASLIRLRLGIFGPLRFVQLARFKSASSPRLHDTHEHKDASVPPYPRLPKGRAEAGNGLGISVRHKRGRVEFHERAFLQVEQQVE